MGRASSTSPSRTGGTGDADGVLAQPEIIGIVNDAIGGHATVICAAGSLPGDLLKLWRPEDPKAYHLEYGYSCMGYEIAGRPRRQAGRARAATSWSWSATGRT